MYTPDIQKPNVLSVSQVTNFIKSLIESEPMLRTVFLSGEISNLGRYSSGFYFSLKDSNSVISAVMFKYQAQRLRFEPKNGQKVLCVGRIELYAPRGAYQIIIENMQPDGLGALNLAYEQLKEKLEKQGLFDQRYKKPIPKMPKTVGVITSPSGAAVQDIKNVLYRRYPRIDVVMCPVLVQGEQAPKQLVEAVKTLDNYNLCDVIIIGRGGGSIEDLWAFNNEELARTIFECKIPVISAVGHQTDYTICDFVADLRAPTPSAAAELAVPDIEELKKKYINLRKSLSYKLAHKLSDYRLNLSLLQKRAEAVSPGKQAEKYINSYKLAAIRAGQAVQKNLDNKRNNLLRLADKTEELSPLAVLKRGYAIAEKDGEIISKSAQLKSGDKFTLIMQDGKINATVD